MVHTSFAGHMAEIHFENEHAKLFWIPDLRAVGGVFLPAEFGEGWDSVQTIKLVLDAGLEIIRKERATRWLSDTREMAVMTAEAQRWCTEDWWPRALAAGFRWLAVLLPQSTMAKLAIDESVRPSDEHAESETRYFSDVEAAKAWLLSKP